MRVSSESKAAAWRAGSYPAGCASTRTVRTPSLGYPEIDPLKIDQRLHQQARADQQRQRQRKLSDDDHFAQAKPRGGSGDAAALLAQPATPLRSS